MNTLAGHSLILFGAGAAAIAVALAIERLDREDRPGSPLVVTQQKRTPIRAPETVAMPMDRDGLVRALQRELKRVGCYGGATSGVWSAAARADMARFLTQINARLPVDEPDDIHLRLLRGQTQRVCAAPCRAEDAEQGSCVAQGPIAIASGQPPERTNPAPETPSARPAPPSIERKGVASDAGAVAMTREDVAAADRIRLTGIVGDARAPSADAEASPPGLRLSPLPPEPQLRQAPRRVHRSRPAKKPPKIVRILIRNVQRSLAPFGIR